MLERTIAVYKGCSVCPSVRHARDTRRHD